MLRRINARFLADPSRGLARAAVACVVIGTVSTVLAVFAPPGWLAVTFGTIAGVMFGCAINAFAYRRAGQRHRAAAARAAERGSVNAPGDDLLGRYAEGGN